MRICGRIQKIQAVQASGATFADCIRALGTSREGDPYARYAAQRLAREGEIEIDEITIVSDGRDGGAYVLAWLWVGNEAAGVADHAEMLEQVLTHAQGALSAADGESALTKLRRDQLDWLEDLITNYAEELDDIEYRQPTENPGGIVWIDREGREVPFVPSYALWQLLLLARAAGLPSEVADRAEQFSLRYGTRLDAMLSFIQTA